LSAQTKAPAVIYLHGFASSAGSTKAQFFKTKIEQAGMQIALPDLNVPSFEAMTLSAQLEAVEACAAIAGEDGRIALMGSSLGGLLAAIAAEKIDHGRVSKLILFAPAFGLKSRWQERLGARALKDWQDNGFRPFFHYAFGREMNLGYDFIEDLDRFETENLKVTVPTLIFHGIKDDSVPIERSREFTKMNQPLVTLKELEDGHELIDTMPAMWPDVERFLIEHN
jgi:uncharacterized protein